jgi:hypothetical protein
VLGIERVAAELEKLDAQCAQVGLASSTSSILVTSEIAKLWGLKLPRGWPESLAPMFNALPYRIAAYIVKREGDRDKALRRVQNMDAILKKAEAKADAA